MRISGNFLDLFTILFRIHLPILLRVFLPILLQRISGRILFSMYINDYKFRIVIDPDREHAVAEAAA